jgi:hypothetical protein
MYSSAIASTVSTSVQRREPAISSIFDRVDCLILMIRFFMTPKYNPMSPIVNYKVPTSYSDVTRMELQVDASSAFVKDTKYIRIKVSQGAKRVVERISEAEDMTEQGIASRVYEWFGAQPKLIQLAIIGRYPADIAPDIIHLILRQLAGPDGAEAELTADARERIQKSLSRESKVTRKKAQVEAS